MAADATAPGGEFGAVGGAEFGAGALEVVFHGAHRDDQPLGDVAVGQPAGGEGDDFAFPVGEGQWCGDGGQGGGGALSQVWASWWARVAAVWAEPRRFWRVWTVAAWAAASAARSRAPICWSWAEAGAALRRPR